jgi:hypothetical protein
LYAENTEIVSTSNASLAVAEPTVWVSQYSNLDVLASHFRTATFKNPTKNCQYRLPTSKTTMPKQSAMSDQAVEEVNIEQFPSTDHDLSSSGESDYVWEEPICDEDFSPPLSGRGLRREPRSISSLWAGSSQDDKSELDDSRRTTMTMLSREDLMVLETRKVKRVKHCLAFFLVACMGFMGWIVYWYASSQEESQFQEQFEEDAKKVLSTLGSNLDRVLEAMDAFSVSLISFARATDQTWPFVVIPDFAVRAEKIRAMSNAVYINTYHMVDVDQREAWELFTSLPEANYWMNETIALQEENPKNVWPAVWNFTSWDVIHGSEEWDKEEPGLKGTNRTGKFLEWYY